MPNIYANTRTVLHPGGVAISGVTVVLYTEAGALITSAVSDANGDAFLGDRAADTYEIRITAPAPGVVTDGPVQLIVVAAAPDPQYFNVLIETTALPVATDVNFCRCSGYFKDLFGTAVPDLAVTFYEDESPTLMRYAATETTHALIPTRRTVTTDSTGYAVIDLMRGQRYGVTIGGMEDIARVITVPDLTSAPLPDVIFPVVDRVEFHDGVATLLPVAAPTDTIAAGVSAEYTVTTFFRSGLSIAGLADVGLESSDTAVLALAITDATTITLTGVVAGNATLQVTRTVPATNYGIVTYPSPVERGNLAVTVSA